MNLLNKALFLMAASLASTQLHAGDKVGNGGGAWVCRELDGSIRKAVPVDLYEIQNAFGLSPAKYPGSYEDVIELVKLRLFRVDRDLYEDLLPYFEKIDNLNASPPKIVHTLALVTPIEDAVYDVRPEKENFCPGGKVAMDATKRYVVPEQVINYKDDGRIIVQGEIFSLLKLDPIKAAVVVFHEALYSYFRERFKDETSDRAREAVVYLFSTLSEEEVKDKLGNVLSGVKKKVLGMEFVPITAGTFLMGSPSNEPGRHNDEDKDGRQVSTTITYNFEMMTTEVTQRLYFEVVGRNPSRFKEIGHCPEDFETRVSPVTGQSESLCPNHPVESVSYEDVQKFIALLNAKTRLNTRLPTEAEWEYAARAGTQTVYSFGDGEGLLGSYTIYEGNSGSRTHAVGPTRNYANLPNQNGLYDMHGNVWEWVFDWYGSELSGGVNPSGPSSGSSRVIRGGSWNSYAHYLRTASRVKWRPGDRLWNVGFRLVRMR